MMALVDFFGNPLELKQNSWFRMRSSVLTIPLIFELKQEGHLKSSAVNGFLVGVRACRKIR
jgi:hypothetical protein